jgi:hypothetical protein
VSAIRIRVPFLTSVSRSLWAANKPATSNTTYGDTLAHRPSGVQVYLAAPLSSETTLRIGMILKIGVGMVMHSALRITVFPAFEISVRKVVLTR